MAVQDHQQHTGDRHQRTERGQRCGPAQSDTLFERLGQRCIRLSELRRRQRAHRSDRDQDVDDR
ncbi:MAG TPA: hypothetical protein VK390_10925, partial [Propionibacteriaceae bacterium]|nr:hypothetical protein [Propionibacteriaceae bacterium]